MRRTKGFTLVELMVVVGIIGLLAAILVPTLNKVFELTKQTACRGNLSNVGKGLQTYLGGNDYYWPWISNKINSWETNKTGTNRGKDPFEDANDPGERSITALPFLLVRDEQPEGMFICPSTDDVKDPSIFDSNTGQTEDEELEYFWDFGSYKNISYSWQAPIKNIAGNYINGIDSRAKDTIVISDQTPKVNSLEEWENTEWRPDLRGKAVEKHMSANHAGKVINALRVSMNADKSDRPDIGFRKDMIYTASNERNRGSQSATSINVDDHKSLHDTLLIGPVGDSNT